MSDSFICEMRKGNLALRSHEIWYYMKINDLILRYDEYANSNSLT